MYLSTRGLGDTCVVYSNGARVCTATPAAASPTPVSAAPTPVVVPAYCNAPLNPKLSQAQRTLMQKTCQDARKAQAAQAALAAAVAQAALVAQQQATAASNAALVATQGPQTDAVPVTSLPAPVPAAAVAPGFDFSSIPTWGWLAGGGLALFLMLRKR